MPDFVTGPADPQPHSTDQGVHLPGVFAAWHRTREAWKVAPIEMEFDSLSDEDYERVWSDARTLAERSAAERIAQARPIVGVLLRAGHRMLLPYPAILPWLREDSFTVPQIAYFKEDPDRLFDINSSDIVCVNESATAGHKARRAADAQRRSATVANRHGHNHNGHNGAERNGHAVTQAPGTFDPHMP